MSDIQKLVEFAANGEKKTDELNLVNGFPATLKPARQWFNYLFNSLTVKINEVIDGLSSEVNNRVNSDNALQQNINNEVSVRANADIILQQNINNETQGRENAIASVQQQISQEQTWRENADNTLQQNINNEAKSRSDNDDWLNQRITNEINTERDARLIGDNNLSNRVTVLENVPPNLSLGVNQAWMNLTSSRSTDTIYTNTTGRTIWVNIVAKIWHVQSPATLIVDGQSVALTFCDVGPGGYIGSTLSAAIPNGSTYKVVSGVISLWAELR